MSSHDSNFSGSLTPIGDPFVDSVIGVPVRALQHQGASDGEQGKRHVTINVLSDDDLREVFHHHCQVNNVLLTWKCQCGIRWKPWWQQLVHVCQRWRRIIFASPNYLNLQLLCDNKTPARASLDIWPPLPIVISYQPDYVNGDQNVIAALEHQDRITKIIFPETSRPVVERLSAFMQEPFPALTELELSGESVPVLPEAFLGGSAPCLRSCTLRGIGFPGLPNLLASTSQLVRLLLHDLPDSGYISPDAMGSCLATLPNLNRLVIGFKLSTYRPRSTSPPPPARDILPSLTHFDFAGSGEYLEDLVARIDAPSLYHFIVTFSVDLKSIASQVIRFISCSERIKELHRTGRVELDPWSVRMTDESGGHLEFGIRHNALSWQLRSLGRLCNNLSPLLSQVGRLRICEDSRRRHQPARRDMEPTQWLNVFLPFTAVHYLSISTKMASIVANALRELTGDDYEDEEVLPGLDYMDFDSRDPRIQAVLNDFYAYRKIDVLETIG